MLRRRKMKLNIRCSTTVLLLLFVVFLLLECSCAGPTKRRACKYRKGTWSRCNFQNKDRSQTLVQTLVPGSATKCEPTIVITRSCITTSNEAEPRLKMMDGGGGVRREGKKGREEQKRKQKHKRKEQNKNKEKMNERKTLPELLRYPASPRMLDVVPHATFADLSWQPPDVADLDHDLHVLSYKIGYGIGFPDRHTLKVNGTATTYRLHGLEPHTVYIVSLRAKTKMGLSEALYMYFRTQNIKPASEEAILPSVVGVRPVVESAEAINISWVDPSRGEEKTLEKKQYYVRYRPLSHLSGSSLMEDFKTLNTSDTFLLVEDLQPFTKYEFSVMASDEEGRNSSWSVMAWSVTQEAAPSTSPEDLTVIEDQANSGRIVLTWQPPSKANGIITGYEVSYNTLSLEGISLVNTKEVKGSKLSVTLTDLIPGETYEFSVQARNSQGIGPPLTIQKHLSPEDSAPEEEDDEESTTAFLSDAPRDLHLNVLSSTSGILSWQDPGFDDQQDITSTYTVRYHSLDMKLANYIVLSSPFSASSLYIDDLAPMTWYQFMVKVRRGDQESSWSMPVKNKTFEADLSQRPLLAEVRGQKRSPQTAILTWEPDPELRIQEYVILYKSDLGQTSRHWTQEAVVGPDVHQRVVERLRPGTTHYFIVQAVAEVGPRPRSKILSYKVPAEDSRSMEIPQPENLQVTVMSSHSALVSWLDPALIRDSQEKQENRPVTSNTYTLRYRELSQRSSGYKFTFPTLSSIFMVDLQPATGYEFSVRTDKGGDRHSQWSLPVVNRTFEAAPSSSPSNVTVAMDDGDPTAVILKWRPPEFSNGDITGYLVFYETANERKSLTVPGGELSYRIQFLKPQTKYFFRVGARNSQGFSPLSNRVIYRTPRVIGTSPTDVTVSPAPEDPYNVIISWQPPSPNRRKINHYTITHYTEDDDKHRSVTKVPGSTLTTVVKKLLPSTAYLFTVQAHYQKGGGPHSAVIKYSISKELLHDS